MRCTYIFHIAGRPSTEAVIIIIGAPTQTYTPELIPNDNPFLRCLRTPARQWLNNGVVLPDSFNLRLGVVDRGVYQCVGVETGQPETDFTGERGSDVYLLTPGMLNIIIVRELKNRLVHLTIHKGQRKVNST